MRRRRALLVVAGGLAAFGACVLLVGARLPSDAVLAAATRALGRPLAIHETRVRLLPGPALELRGVRLAEAGTVAGCAAAFEAGRVRLRLAVWPLLAGRAVVDRVDVDAPVLRLVRPAQAIAAEADAPAPGAGAAKQGVGEPAHAVAAAAERGAAMHVRRVRIRDGRIQLFDERSGTRLALVRLDASVRPEPDAPRAALSLEALLRRIGHEGATPLALTGRVAWERGDVRLAARVGSGEVRIGSLRLDGIDGRVRVDPRGLHVRDLAVAVGEGVLAGRARARLRGERDFALTLAGSGDDVASALEGASVTLGGRWQARLAVREAAAPPRGARARRALRGGGRLVVQDGVIEPFELGGGILDVVAPLRGREQRERLRTRYPELFGGRRLRFRTLAGSVRVGWRRLRTRDLVLEGGDYRADAVGTVGLGGALALDVRLATSARLARDLLGQGALPALAGVEADRGLVVPLRVEGTIRRPRVRPAAQWSRELLRRSLGESGLGSLLEKLLR